MSPSKTPEVFQPPINRYMDKLDRSFFKKVVPTSAFTIFDAKQISNVRGILTQSRETLNRMGIRPIVDDETDPRFKCIVLQPGVKADDPGTWSPQLTNLVNEGFGKVRAYSLVLTYPDWTMQDILEAVLPELPEDQKETPAGFAQAGHIAHVNLRSQYLPYKHFIGQVLIDKNPNIRTVVNKTLDVGSVSEFRTFPHEILAGDNDLEVTLSNQGCEFKFNFSQVYWNTRLDTEHKRIVAKFKPGEAVCDAMAGVGPFAIPAGKKKVFVRANDLNPQSYAGLCWAIERNKVFKFVSASCRDAHNFIREATSQLSQSPRSFVDVPKLKIPRNASPAIQMDVAQKRLRGTVTYKEPKTFDHYVMNLPATAVEFLDAFLGLYKGRESEFVPNTNRKLPMIHVYTFQARKDTEAEEMQGVCETVSQYLGAEVKPTDEDVEIFDVRLVSPMKKYYCASFRLPPAVAFTL